jgi:CubicO group peptidase (beta-lactamase class C family)
MNPGTGDGFVMLTNHSSGFEAYRWALCDWVRWVAAPSFGYICNDRDKQALGPMGAALYGRETKRTATRVPFVDSLARSLSSDTTPGLAVLVMRDGVVTHSAGYGLADMATRASITESTPFYLASISKQFTAFAILRLADEGLLALDDPLARFIPELHAPAAQATIRQALTHSSGIPDYYRYIQSWPALRHLDNADVLDTLLAKPLDFPSGTTAKYSNSGYVLLATIVERVSRRPYSAALAELVLKPAGMRQTVSLDDSTPFPRGRAVGYDSSGGRLLVSDYGAFESANGRRGYIDMRTVGAGGMYSTLRDLAAWELTLEKGGILKPTTFADVFRLQQRADGEHGVDTVSGYGYGWIVSRRYGTEVVWHDGGFAGFRNIILRVPSRKLMIAVLSNSSWIDHHRLAVAIADRLMTEPKTSER